jgi:succinylarginine dihydrolase
MPNAFEVNFDGLVGPTHNYAGLSWGNIASLTNQAEASNPKEAALQGLAKMKFLADLGLEQAVFPPHERPAIETLRHLGFSGDDAGILEHAQREAPEVLIACSSASSMWSANAATMAPSADSADGKVHFTPANLTSKFHRSIEPPTTARILRAIFHDESLFMHHPALEGGVAFGDEGAANHTRLCPDYADPGLHVFVYGRSSLRDDYPQPSRYPARQSFEACAALARLHQLPAERVLIIQQNPAAIDAGVFHNDVISVGNESLFFYHEEAFIDTDTVITELQRRYRRFYERELCCVKVTVRDVSLEDAIKSYLFNSQIVTLPDNRMALIAPVECREHSAVHDVIERMKASKQNPLCEVHYLDLRQSMRNGGGPACLRQRVVLSERELATIPPAVFITADNYVDLVAWVERHYRDSLRQADLADPQLLQESRTALDELTELLGLGSIYPFQVDSTLVHGSR